jgi:hypothetical protein
MEGVRTTISACANPTVAAPGIVLDDHQPSFQLEQRHKAAYHCLLVPHKANWPPACHPAAQVEGDHDVQHFDEVLSIKDRKDELTTLAVTSPSACAKLEVESSV